MNFKFKSGKGTGRLSDKDENRVNIVFEKREKNGECPNVEPEIVDVSYLL